jgi:hypothetical protein
MYTDHTIRLLPRRRANWLTRAAFTLAGAAFALVCLFFVTVALVAGALLAVGIAARWWWLTRRNRALKRQTGPLEGEYRVIEGAAKDKELR